MMGRGIPDRWLPYSSMGSIIPGTRFMACKVPLKEALLRSLPQNQRFGTRDLLEAFPKIGLLVDLTNTTRYYLKTDFTDKEIRYEKIFCPGKVIPPNSIIKQFFDVVDDYLATETDPDTVIVVHCTHGVNRTGYFICRYMIEKMNISPEEAVRNFQNARGHNIERDSYVNDLKNGCKGGNESDLCFVPKSNRRDARGSQQRMTYSKIRYRDRETYKNDEIPEKRYRNDNNLKQYSDYHNKKWNENKHRQKYFNNFDGHQLPEGRSNHSVNWRDRAGDQNPPLQSTIPLSGSPQSHRQRISIIPEQFSNTPHSQTPRRLPSTDNDVIFPKQGQFTCPPPKGFRGSLRGAFRGPPKQGFIGPPRDGFRGPPRDVFKGSREGFRPLPKFCYPESSNETSSSLRGAEDSISNPQNSLYSQAGIKTSSSEFKGNYRGRMLRRGRDSGRGGSRRKDEIGPQYNNFSRQ